MSDEYITIYAIIPSYLYKTKELTSGDKLIAERITALCKKTGYAWINNKTLALMYGIKEDTVSRHIKKLKDIGFIKCIYKKDKNNKSDRIIYLSNNIWDKHSGTDRINIHDGIGYLYGHNNKYNNNINNNIISYDEDGVMLWNGKRCESNRATAEQIKEMELLLSKYKGDSIE